ncbi:hypothetical protein TREMEDRAFT_29866 [Tremella mesenterica DSM 1558]|uniref:uncharacterized protein n=1 Tax=Tremella mesenterica (strain ATCC 24925 / CBS 8224 / DSM 1558 / NBRC 9311 / NRRL Y-6157 / RJB 2259-6 / UBC 559-6) TaxID=578456 RepID=UPI0003F493F6|nr:uncharacterized protein TREMEDRAFT_29866 [Tremella mesenterica DSM 1558]EIW69921.1 hypothetical protein TREMEDRAFT_29866 [Tremella mesenterica DSM 1558]
MLRTTLTHTIIPSTPSRLLIRYVHAQLAQTEAPLEPHSIPSVDPSRFPLYRPDPHSPSLDHVPPRPSRSPRHVEQSVISQSKPSDIRSQRKIKARLSAQLTADLPELDEQALRSFYAALVLTGSEEDGSSVPRIMAPELKRQKRSTDVLTTVEQRLLEMAIGQQGDTSLDNMSESRTQMGLAQRMETGEMISAGSSEVHQRVTQLLGTLSVDADPKTPTSVPLGILSRGEWEVLLQEYVNRHDPSGAERVLQLVESHGMSLKEGYILDIMNIYAKFGRPHEIMRLQEIYVPQDLIVPPISDVLIRAHLQTTPPDYQAAISILKQHETFGSPLSQTSYNFILHHLTSSSPHHQPTSHTRALAWDLFTHMRLTAHPIPTTKIYNTMILACSVSSDPQPERARDLWIEMTEGGIIPQREEYDAIIRALCSTRKDYLEGFDLLRQMLAKHTDATFRPFEDDGELSGRWSNYVPTVNTFTALLEGTKRAGDLMRARWALTEVVKLMRSVEELGHGEREWLGWVNDELLSGVFMTYAAWKPPVSRKMLKEVAQTSENIGPKHDNSKEIRADRGVPQDDLFEVDMMGELYDISSSSEAIASVSTTDDQDNNHMPMTSSDALREAEALFVRLVQDISSSNHDGVFSHVQLGPKLVNSYLSVHLAHSSSLELARNTWEATWSQVSTRPNGWSYLQALERCSRGRMSSEDRDTALSWGEELWKEYIFFANHWDHQAQQQTLHSQYLSHSFSLGPIHDSSTSQSSSDTTQVRRLFLAGLGPRQVEKTWRARIRLLTLSEHLDQALDNLKDFYTLYPPEKITMGYTPVQDMGLAVRATDRTIVAEPDIPPHMLFEDVDVLHQRLVRDERWEEVAWLKWVLKGWEEALKRRRKWRMRGVGEGRKGLVRLEEEVVGNGLSG